jgi:hypothetical protein
MSQYTEKINKIAEDFKIIEEYETCSCLLAQNGCMIITYRHGGYTITAGDKGGEYNGYQLEPNETKIIPSHEEYYLKLKKRYGEKEGRTFTEILGEWKKQLNNYIERKFK